MSGDERMDTTESGQWGSNSPRAAEEAENGWGESAPKQDDDQGWGVSADRNGSDRRDDDRSRDRYADDRDRRDDRRDRSRSPARSREAEEDNSAQNPGNNLFVTNLSKVTREDQLEDLFIKYGKIEKLSIMYDPHTRESRQFAFVTFQRVDDADAAVAALNDYELDGKRIIVEKAKRAAARKPTPGRYYGPPKPEPRRRVGDRFDPRRDRYDDRDRYDRRDRYDDRRDRYDDRDRYDRRDRYDDRRDRYDDRRRDRYDDDRRRY